MQIKGFALPVAGTGGLNPAQAAGRSCASCGKRVPLAFGPVAVTLAGVLLRVCEDCVPPRGGAG